MKSFVLVPLMLLGCSAAPMPHDGLKVAHTSEEDKKVLKEMDEWYKTKYHKYSGHARLSQGDLLDDVNPVGDLTDQVTEGVTGEEEKTEEQEELEEAAEEAAFKGLAPLFGRNLLSVLFTDLVNVFAAPSGPNLLALLIDSFFFVLFPLIGGIMNMSVLYNYELDPVTFQNSGLVKQDLYADLM